MATIRVNKNEATAARRRVYFHCVDATDGMSAETGEAGGQPQVSVDGAAWTNTGIGTLTAIGNGRYYAELTQALVNVDDAVVETRYKSANTAEAVGDTVVVDAKVEAAAAVLALVDTEVASILAAVDTEVAAIKAKTDALPAAPAAEGTAAAAASAAADAYAAASAAASDVSTVLTNLAVVDGVADAIKAKTDALPAAPAAVGSAMILTPAYDAAKAAASQASVDAAKTSADGAKTSADAAKASADAAKASADLANRVAPPSAAAIDEVLSASHGVGEWGPVEGSIGFVEVTGATLDDSGVALGPVTVSGEAVAGASVLFYLGTTLKRVVDTDGDGGFSALLPVGATYRVLAFHDGVTFPERQVTV